MYNDYYDFVQEVFYSKAISKSPNREKREKYRTELANKLELTLNKNFNII